MIATLDSFRDTLEDLEEVLIEADLGPHSAARITERGATRGNGEVGEDVTPNVAFVSDIPQTLPDSAAVKAVSTADANGRVLESIAYKNLATGGWRMTLPIS